MPTFDGGHYFLTCLAPVRTEAMSEDGVVTSPVHALRKRLSMLQDVGQQPGALGGQSPFARNTRNHFARFVVIDDVAYNGRDPADALWTAIRRDNLIVPRAQDRLSCPFLLFAVEFDAANGTTGERDSYLAELWRTSADDLRGVFELCRDFDSTVADENSFANYIARCQIETTMSFSDYYPDIGPPNLPTWPARKYLIAALIIGVPFLLSIIAALGLVIAEMFAPPALLALRVATGLMVLSGAALAALAATAFVSVSAAGAKPFPAAPESALPVVLKALYLQRAFMRFAIDSQMDAAGDDAASAQRLYDRFAKFIADAKPSDLGAPTQAPGVIDM
jgi:hypothetical protein